MRITQVLGGINKYRFFQTAWLRTKRAKAPASRELIHVQKLGLPTIDAEDFLKKVEEEIDPVEIDSDVQPAEPLFEKVQFDENHPLYKPDPRFCIDDWNILLEGVEQSKLLLNTVQVQEGLPKEVEDAIGTRALPFQDTRVKRLVMYSNVYDAMQVKLPKPKPIEWDYLHWQKHPTQFGINSKRKFNLTMTQMLQLCDYLDGKSCLINRDRLNDAYCCATLEKEGIPFQIRNTADMLVTSKVPISPLTSRTAGQSIPLPDLHPIKFNVSIPKTNFYQDESIYPISKEYVKSNPHTAFFHFDPYEVKNLYEEPVTDSQFYSRTLVKAFAVAASRAQQLYGENVKQLPEPITLQAVHTDSRRFHFGVLQLNTLDLSSSNSERNIFWMLPHTIDLFSNCAYVKGRPTLEDYNPEVFQRILSFFACGL